MEFRNSQAVKVAVSALVLVISAVLIARYFSGGGGAARGGEYFYDLKTGELFVVPLGTPSPLGEIGGGGASGDARAGVRAHVYDCGQCSPNSRRIAYLSRSSNQALRVMGDPEASPEQQFTAMESGVMVAPVPATPGDAIEWLPNRTSRGAAIQNRIGADCPPGVMALDCRP